MFSIKRLVSYKDALADPYINSKVLTVVKYVAITLLLASSLSSVSARILSSFDSEIVELIMLLTDDADENANILNRITVLLEQRNNDPDRILIGDDSIETPIVDGTWQGIVENIPIEDLDAAGNIASGSLRGFLITNDEQLMLFFLDGTKAAELQGLFFEVEGIRTADRLLVTTGRMITPEGLP